jgi:hypothetical protein
MPRPIRDRNGLTSRQPGRQLRQYVVQDPLIPRSGQGAVETLRLHGGSVSQPDMHPLYAAVRARELASGVAALLPDLPHERSEADPTYGTPTGKVRRPRCRFRTAQIDRSCGSQAHRPQTGMSRDLALAAFDRVSIR